MEGMIEAAPGGSSSNQLLQGNSLIFGIQLLQLFMANKADFPDAAYTQ